jgi:hypothetical protein
MAPQGIDVGEPHPAGTSPRGWARSKLSDLFNANSDEELDRAFDAFVAEDVQVTVNGENLSREKYKEQMERVAPLGGAMTKEIRFDAEVEEQAEPDIEGNKVSKCGLVHSMEYKLDVTLC